VELLEDRTLLAAPHPFDLSTLDGSNGFRLDGIDAEDHSGWSVKGAGDVNGDGYADVLVGAKDANAGGDSAAGETYVVFGSGSGFAANLDLSTLDGSNGFRLDGIDANDNAGESVSAAGDVNGDGLDDILIGAHRANHGTGGNQGETYAVFGSNSEFVSGIDLSTLDGSNGFRLDGIDSDDLSGYSVSIAGDVNGDGYADFLVGAYRADPGGDSAAGETYVVFGSGSGFAANLDLSTLDGSNGFRLDGIDSDDLSGASVSTAGDVNGDGYADILVGANGADPDGVDGAGETYIVFGSGEEFAASLDLTVLDGANGFRLHGIDIGDSSGWSVSTAGDVNGDGYDDILVGTWGADGTGDSYSGEAYVVFGSASEFPSSLDLETLDGTIGFRLDGEDAADYFGSSVSTAGDVNGDGYDDILIGAYGADPDSSAAAGEAYVVFGSASEFPSSLDLETLDGTIGFRLDGEDAGDFFGFSVSAAGDVNGDGYDDMLVGAHGADPGGDSYAGETYVVFGADFTEDVTHAGTTGADTLTGDGMANVMVAGQGNDIVTGGGGADVIYAAEGNDTIAVSDTTFARIDGGSGDDTLRLDGSGLTLDLTTIADNKLRGIELIDLTGTGANTLVLSVLEVLNLSDTSNSLAVTGDADDVVFIGLGWTYSGVVDWPSDGQAWRFTNGAAELLVQDTIALDHLFVVDTVADTVDANPGDGLAADADGYTSLRAAVMESNALPWNNTITLPAGTYSFTITGTQEDAAAQGDLDVTEGRLTISGAGESESIIHANYVDRVFDVHSGATLDLTGITISGGGVTMDADDGGGIHNRGTLTLTDSILTDNTAVKGGGIWTNGTLQMVGVTVTDNLSRYGGGVLSSGGDTEIDLSTFQENTAHHGGGIRAEGGGVLLIQRTTFRENVGSWPGSSGYGGAVDIGSVRTTVDSSSFVSNLARYSGGAIIVNTTTDRRVEVTNSTFTQNEANQSYGGAIYVGSGLINLVNCTITGNHSLSRGGGVYLNSSAVTNVQNSIIAGNTAGHWTNGHDVNGMFFSQGNNLIGDVGPSIGFTHGEKSDQVGTTENPIDPLLAPLADNGGPTLTHAPLPGSPAVDAGKNVGAPATGQRGIARPLDSDNDGSAIVDIGAVELVYNNPPTLDAVNDPIIIDEDAGQQDISLVGITAGAGETQLLQVTAVSDNAGLIPNPTVTYTSNELDGSLAYTPLGDASGTAVVTVTVTDAGLDNDLQTIADNASFSRTFTVTVDAVNDLPLLDVISDPAAIDEDDGQQSVSLAGITAGAGETQTLQVTATSDNTGLIPDPTVTYTTDETTGSLAYTPVADASGTAVVTVTVTDAGLDGDLSASGDNGTFSRTFTVTVNATNDLPVAVADNFTTNEDGQLTVTASGVLINDTDIEGTSLTAVLAADVAHGTLALVPNGGFNYTPDTGYYGTDSFNYKANDGIDDGNTVTVTIDVIQHPEIHGTLFHDLDGDETLDVGEPELAGWTVFLDTSDDGIFDAGESSTTTLDDERGNYSFVDLVPGDYTVAWISPTGWEATTSSQSLTLAAGDVQEDVDLFDRFIVSATPTITTVSFADDGSADTITIGPNDTNVEVTVNGNVWIRRPASELTSITVNGSGDDDTLIVDLGGLAAEITFNGGGDGSDNDTLQFRNGEAASIAYSFANATDGTITIDMIEGADFNSIEFSGLESILDSLTTDHREFTFATTDDVVTLADDGASDNGLLTLSSVSSSETVTFANPGTSLGIHLGSGADQLTVVSLDVGFAGALTLNGEGGDDVIDASAVNVAIKLNGSGGNDTLTGGTGGDTLNGGSGSDSLVGGAGNDRLQGQGGSYDTLSGGPGDDTLDGGDGYDRISETADVDFSATDDLLTGLGNDTLINIQLVQLFGGSSDNTIDASAFTGRAFLNGSGGHDTLTGGGWYDRLFGGSGRDLITGGDSVVDPGTGLFTYDVLRGQGGNYDTLIGGDGNDKLNGGAGHDSLVGGGGDDVLTGEAGNDTIAGGDGTDRLYERGDVDLTLTDTGLTGGLGNDAVSSIETAYLKGGNGDNLLDASAFSGDVTLIGVGGADTLRGGSGNDMLNGRSGADSITGGDGDDTLKGLRDNDTLNGGAGDDWLDGGTQDDRISGWTGDDILYGRSGNDILVGGDGHDSLYGASGDDLLQGDDGKTDTSHSRDDDRLDGGTDGDTIRGGGGSDTMLDDASEIDESFAYWAEWVDAV
jgi:Ca2+-binding RTX toxin-like protein